MPQYGLFQYGEIYMYGKYLLSTTDGVVIGPHVRHRIRIHTGDSKGEFIEMIQDRVEVVAPLGTRMRIRANNGEWVRTQTEEVQGDVYSIRIRSVDSEGTATPWVHTDRGELEQI